MNTKSLEYFVKVVDLNSFTKAAEELFISQSAISQQIKSLEDELGFELMRRSKKGFELTPAGRYVYLEGKNIINNIKKVSSNASYISKNKSQTLRIGYVNNYGYHEIEKALMIFSNEYPEVKLEIKGGTHEVVSLNNVNDLSDIMIGDQRKRFSESYNNIHVGDLYYSIRVSNTCPLATKNNVTLGDLNGYKCILVAGREESAKEIEFIKTTLEYDGEYIYASSLTEANLMVSANLGFLLTASKLNEKTRDDCITSLPLYRNNEILVSKFYAYYKKSFDESVYEKLVNVLKNVMK